MKTLNLKKMAKEMSLEDQATLLFADSNLRFESDDVEFVLTLDERETIVETCRDRNLIVELNRYNQYYNLVHKALVDLRMRTLELKLMLSHLGTAALGAYLHDCSSESNGEDMYSWFTPVETPSAENFEEYMNHFMTREPNHGIQHIFANAVFACRRLKQVLFMMNWFEGKSKGVRYLGDRDMINLTVAQEMIKSFEAEDGFLSAIKMYRDAHAMSLMRKSDFAVPTFELFLLNPDIALELTQEEREEVEKVIQRALKQ